MLNEFTILILCIIILFSFIALLFLASKHLACSGMLWTHYQTPHSIYLSVKSVIYKRKIHFHIMTPFLIYSNISCGSRILLWGESMKIKNMEARGGGGHMPPVPSTPPAVPASEYFPFSRHQYFKLNP